MMTFKGRALWQTLVFLGLPALLILWAIVVPLLMRAF